MTTETGAAGAAELGLILMSRAAGDANTADADLVRLIKLSRAGDLTAFEQIMRLHDRRVFRTALRLLRRIEDAEDASQEVFLRVHKHLDRFNEAGQFSAWVYRITVNVCRDINRKRSKGLALSLDAFFADGGSSEPASQQPDPLDQASQTEDVRLAAVALRRLPEKERAAVVLRDIEGLSTSEVAGILGSSETTVRSQVSRARLKLKKWRDELNRSRT